MLELEKDVERALVKMVKRHGGRCLKFVSPNVAGVPDRILLLPFGRVVFVELKRPNYGRATKLQRYWYNELWHLGFPCYFVVSKDGVTGLELTLFGGGDDEV